MYKKTEWKARKGVNLNRFEKSQETSRSVILENRPTAVTEPGTPHSPPNMNKMEQGIYDAHEMIGAEAQERRRADNSLAQEIAAEAHKRQAAINAAINTEATARQHDYEALHYQIADLIMLVEKKLGPFGGSFPIVTDDGFYLVTDDDDYIVTA